MTDKPAGHEDVPEDVRQLAASYAGRMADVLLGEGDDPDFIAILADCILADRSRRAKAPAQAPELAPDVKGLVERLRAEADMYGYGQDQPTGLLREAANRLSAPPAEAKPVAWSEGGMRQALVMLAAASRDVLSRLPPGASIKHAGATLTNRLDSITAEIEARLAEPSIIVHPDPRAKAAEAVPEGMVLVPRQATQAMEVAARKFVAPYHDTPREIMDSCWPGDMFRLAYKAMLAAAPQPLSTGEVK